MKYSFYLILSLLAIGACGTSEETRNPPEIVSRDSDTVFNNIPGKHHLRREAFNMNIVEYLENIRKTHSFLDVLAEEGLRDTLETDGPFTVFALSDATLEPSGNETEATSDAGNAISGEEVKRYIIRGRISRADLAEQSITAQDMAGNSVTIGLENGNLVIDDKVYHSFQEFAAANGAIYELRKPLE